MIKIEELYKQPESQRLELKESFGKETVETVAAFSNASGGEILIGVNGDGTVKGVNVNDEIIKDWINVIKQATQPQIFPEINPVVIDGKTIVCETLADLQIDLIVKFFRQIGNTGRISLQEDPMVNLKKIGLIKEDQLTFAALLLFGEHQTGIHIGRFKSQDIIIDDILIKSPLVVAVDEAMTFIKKSISLRN
jgi:ATP-dependent DNA helicase RecG